MASSNTKMQPDLPSENSRIERLYLELNNIAIPKFDWKTLPPAGPELKLDVSQRVKELQKYLRENKYPTQEENILAAIEMYNRKELPRSDANCIYIQGGKLTDFTVESALKLEPMWMEVCFKTID